MIFDQEDLPQGEISNFHGGKPTDGVCAVILFLRVFCDVHDTNIVMKEFLAAMMYTVAVIHVIWFLPR